MSSKGKAGGMGLISILTVVFIVLKLTKLIAWSWLWVLSPLWITAALLIVLFAAALITGRIKKGKW